MDIKKILNKAMLTDKDLEAIGLRKATTLANDRCNGLSILPFIRVGGRQIRYKRRNVLEALSGKYDLPPRDLNFWEKNPDLTDQQKRK